MNDSQLEQVEQRVREMFDEIRNFQEIARQLVPAPGETPAIEGMDIDGLSRPLNGIVGGDHIIYVDFNQRFDLDARIAEALQTGQPERARRLAHNRTRAGILLADVAGHRLTDAVLTAMLHQAFLLGVTYELDQHGETTTRLFENLNARFAASTCVNKFVTVLYGEVSQGGGFEFITAGHPLPVVFSNEFNRIMDIGTARLRTFPPVGTMLSRADIDTRRQVCRLGCKDDYEVNEINLIGRGDIMLLYSDGFAEHGDATGRPFFPEGLQDTLRVCKDQPAREICRALDRALSAWGPQADDLSVVVVKRC